MRNVITVMNAKGGVGKSTLVLALADTLSAHHGKRVLVIDSDAHASISSMMLPQPWLQTTQAGGQTIVDYFIATVLRGDPVRWREFTVKAVSDIEGADTIDLIPAGSQLTLFEREVSRLQSEVKLRLAVRAFLAEARAAYDCVLIDSAPGLSILTESWLREADYYISPTKPDYASIRGLQFLDQFRQHDLHIGFAEPLGVVIYMKEKDSIVDEQFDRWLRRDARNLCFRQTILQSAALQAASHFSGRQRSYRAKYPGRTGKDLRSLTLELLSRLEAGESRVVRRTGRRAKQEA
jgi:chromosome partitioning protein